MHIRKKRSQMSGLGRILQFAVNSAEDTVSFQRTIIRNSRRNDSENFFQAQHEFPKI